jgi:hypothetical protein
MHTPFSTITPEGDLITPVPVEQIDSAWPSVSAYLDRAIKRSADPICDVEDLRKDCLKKDAILWVAVRGHEVIAAIITRIEKFPKYEVLSIPWIGGKHLRAWLKPMLETLEAYGRHFGCKKMMGSERAGWCRVAGFKPATELFERAL